MTDSVEDARQTRRVRPWIAALLICLNWRPSEPDHRQLRQFRWQPKRRRAHAIRQCDRPRRPGGFKRGLREMTIQTTSPQNRFMQWTLALLASVALLCSAPEADARGGGRFGSEDKFVEVQSLDISPELANDPNLRLGGQWSLSQLRLYGHYKIQWFFLGAYVERDGYVLKPPGADIYFPLDDEKISALQQLGVLPDPLPAFAIPALDYAFGYSLWILIAGILIWVGGGELVRKRRAKVLNDAIGDDFYAFICEALINFAGLGAGGGVSVEERKQIKNVLANLGLHAQAETIETRYESTTVTTQNLLAYVEGKKLTDVQRVLLLRSLISLADATGGLGKDKRRGIEDYLVAFGVAKKHVKREADKVIETIRAALARPPEGGATAASDAPSTSA